ncbi:GNAT family N-acetyltransferase [Streptomyces sp. NPDC091412]|uniref:GNAT family N-acetyltransferase n=1 Tax=Streptomyces sp. NPDC091412 TaxID=3366002 RepID=UPI0038201A9E
MFSTIACFGGGVDVVRAGVGRDDAGAGEAAGELVDACGDRGLPVDGSVPATVGFADTAASLAGPHALAATVTVRLAAASSRGLRRFFIEDLFMARRSVPSVCGPASHTYITKVPPPLWLRREAADPRVRSCRGGPYNAESKLLLFGHAFDDLGLARIALRTDNLNERSQQALTWLGLVYEGMLRSHMVRQDGTRRDSLYYGVLADEWPSVRHNLLTRVAAKVTV